jgi:hypothetical protein
VIGHDPPPLPIRARADAGPPTPIAIAVGRPTSPTVHAVFAAALGLATLAWAGPPREMAMAMVHHSALEDAGAHVLPSGT